MKIDDNLCSLIKNRAENITSSNAKNTLKEIKNKLSTIENSNHNYTIEEKNTISILKIIELENPCSPDIKHNNLLDKKCIESIIKINNKYKKKDIFAIRKYSDILNKIEKEHIKKTSKESEINKQNKIDEENEKKETLLKNNKTLFNKVEDASSILDAAIKIHYNFFKEITKKIKIIDNKEIFEKTNEYRKETLSVLKKIENHTNKDKDKMDLAEFIEYIQELEVYNDSLTNLIENIKELTEKYGKSLEIINRKNFKASNRKILNMMNYHLGELKEINLQIN